MNTSDESPHDETPTVNFKPQWLHLRIGMQVGILSMLTFLGIYITLWADRHNDGRYVLREEYQKDRSNDEALRASRDTNIQQRLTDLTKAMDNVGQDVKQILRENRK